MGSAPAATGVDAGATLTKLAFREDAATRLLALPSEDPDAVLAALADATDRPLALTGGGAVALARRLPRGTVRVDEFRAWSEGVSRMLGTARPDRFLLVSIGTGTSILLVDGDQVQRLAGTPLGGGTVLGLGAALVGAAGFEDLCRLAASGDRSRVDLSVADVYREGEAPLATDVMASSFARLAPGPHAGGRPARRADLARSLLAMVGENVALLVGSLSLATGVSSIVIGGTTVQENPTLTAALSDYLGRFGRKPVVLEKGGFAGAVGAAWLAEGAA
jgi:type II pantothenate kinase